MSNYIIAGEVGSHDLVECEHLGKKLEASTPSTQVHVIAKHASEWEDFLKKICTGYGFKEFSNPIIFTVDGKFIGDKHAFKEHVLKHYSVKAELDKNMKNLISDHDKMILETHRKNLANGPSVEDIVKAKIKEIVKEGGIKILDGFFEKKYDQGFEFYFKKSEILSPFTYDEFNGWGENLEFNIMPELIIEKPKEEMLSPRENKLNEEALLEAEEDFKEEYKEDLLSDNHEKEKSPSMQESPLASKEDEANSDLLTYELDDKNIRNFIQYFKQAKPDQSGIENIFEVPIPSNIKTIPIYESNIIRRLPKDYALALNPFPLIPEEMIIFSGKIIEDGLLLRDPSTMENWLKVINIPPQKPVYKDGDILEPIVLKEPVHVRDIFGLFLNQRGLTYKLLDLNLECARDPTLKLRPINIIIRHILTESDWEVWSHVIKELNAIGYYQMLPYGEIK
jgi:hypothetical protein